MTVRGAARPVERASARIALLAAALLLAACSSGPPPPTFDLTAPRDVPSARAGRAQLVVTELSALDVLNSNQVMVRKGGQVSYLGGVQWADRLPRLIQARLIQTFENDHRIAAVGRPEDRITPDATLVGELRSFEIDASGGQAIVQMSVKLVNAQTGRIVAAQLFSASRPTAPTGTQAAAALDFALQQAMRDIVAWADSRV